MLSIQQNIFAPIIPYIRTFNPGSCFISVSLNREKFEPDLHALEKYLLNFTIKFDPAGVVHFQGNLISKELCKFLYDQFKQYRKQILST